MKKNIYNLVYDALCILIATFIYIPFVSIHTIFTIAIFNISLIFIFLLINFYKSTFIQKIFYKLKIILLATSVLSVLKILFFGFKIYSEIIFLQDILLFILIILPRIFLNIREFKINFIKNYNISRQGTLVIGGLGYIGSELTLELLKNNQKVSILDCAMFGDKVIKKFSTFPNFNFIKGYASDVILLSKLLRENSKVVHLAGLVGDPACSLDEKDTIYFNIKTTNIIKELCIEYEIRRLIFASSCSVYGSTDELCHENTPTKPVSLYAKTKVDSENELLESSIDTKILRFSTIFGPSERLRFDLVVNLFIAQAYYDKKITVFGGNQERPFLHVKDASKSILNFLNHKITGTQDLYNIGCDELNGTINQVAELIKKNIPDSNISLSLENVDARNYAVSFKKYNNLFPNQKFTTIESAIKEFIDIFEKTEIKFKENLYSNLLTTKSFINDKKSQIKIINNFLYE